MSERIPIDDARLRAMKHLGDPVADALATDYLVGNSTARFHAAMKTRYSSPEMMDPEVASFLNAHPPLPEWATTARLKNGADFFALWGVQLGLGLFLQALPLAYASVEGVQVLALTSKLETDANRRVLESAQFVLDVTSPRALEPGKVGYETTRHVRLMHAGVRYLIEHDERIERTSDPDVWPRWDPAWGTPINQQHLLGAMLSYSSSLLEVLDVIGADYDEIGAADYCLLWNVVGWLLGVDEALLPLERNEMERLQREIRRSNEGASDAGRTMTEALLKLVQSYAKVPGLKGLPITLMRLFIGDRTADFLGVPPTNWTRVLVRTARHMGHNPGRHHRVLHKTVAWASSKVLRGFVAHERGDDRPTFSIPTHLDLKVAKRRRPDIRPRRAHRT
jgi:hypothetical protein